MPITNSAGEGRQVVDPAYWRLVVRGPGRAPLRLSYADVLALAGNEQAATLDCTTGWYSSQVWRGVPLAALLERAGLSLVDPAAAWVRVRGISGYLADFTVAEAQGMLLAAYVGGEVLDHWHGFPLRAVAPTRRGWFWVKWVTEVEVLTA
jgi:DMSO/TMAO reductase YedYZ molybdopterin-dependent catalytic subunit